MNASYFGKLLYEISWEDAKRYRKGGIGLENVLTAEVFQGLDLLPRKHFLGELFRKIHGCSDYNGEVKATSELLFNQSEDAIIDILPSQSYYLKPSNKKLSIQPDATIETPGIFVLVEAKRIRSCSFQRGQLSREFVLATRDAGTRIPLLLLILGQEPPIKVTKCGYRPIKEDIVENLEIAFSQAENHPVGLDSLGGMIDTSVTWITWNEIAEVITSAMDSFHNESLSVRSSVLRIARSVIDSIERHR